MPRPTPAPKIQVSADAPCRLIIRPWLGNAFVTDVVQRNSYRRNRQRDLDRLNFDVRTKRREQARERFQNRREALNQRLEDKTAKRRAKRQAKRAKKEAAAKQTESTHS